MRYRFFISIFLLFFITGCNNEYESIEEAIQSQRDEPITILNYDEELQVVYYVENNQYILGEYEKHNGKYVYLPENSIGHRPSTKDEIPIIFKESELGKKREVIYGSIITELYEVDTFEIHYGSGEVQSIKAKNNSFITLPLNAGENSDESIGVKGVILVKALDQKGELITSLP
ncbi:hypothetical protein ACWE42_15460 [Sutcliffiella cohnii]